MQTQIAIIATEYLRDFIHTSMRKLHAGFSYEIYSYASFEELPDIYRSIPESVGGVLTTGSFPLRILKHTFPHTTRVIRPINNDDGDIYKLLLMLLGRFPGLTTKRVYMDPVDVLGMDLDEYIACGLEQSYSDRLEARLDDWSLEQLMQKESEYRTRHLALWEEGRIDVSVTRFSSIMYQLEDAGLPVFFPYPSLAHMERVCHETVQAVTLRHLRDNQAAAIVLTHRKADDAWEEQRRTDMLHKALVRYAALSPHNLTPSLTPHGFEVLTKRETVKALTDHFRSCGIQAALKETLGFGVSIGYGLGENIHQARMNAVDANREAALSASGVSCLVNERDELVCPLGQNAPLVVQRDTSPEVRLVSKKTGLSGLTVQKLFAAVRSSSDGRVSARELAEKLSITPRSANRFFSVLMEAGFAEIADVRRGTSRGRPERVYVVRVPEAD